MFLKPIRRLSRILICLLLNFFRLNTGRVSLWITFGLTLATTQLALAARVGVLISEPRGGYGDTATNLMMIERMAEFYRDSNIHLEVLYFKQSEPQIHDLWPDFQVGGQKQLVRGLLFTPIAKAPAFDFVITFSASADIKRDKEFLALKGKKLIYLEYGQSVARIDRVDGTGRDSILDQDPWQHGPVSIDDADRELTPRQEIYKLNTGFPFGLYALDGFRALDEDKTLTLSLLRQFSGKEFPQTARLGYVYCASPELAQQYVNAASKYSEKYSIPLVIVSNQPVTSWADSVQIVPMTAMPFSLNQKVIKSSDVPILVTGDGSLTLAIEGRKTFFYALYSWKILSTHMLKEEILKRSPLIRKDPRAKTKLTEMLTLDLGGTTDHENLFFEVFDDLKLQNEFSRVYKQMVQENSLVRYLEKDFTAVTSFDKRTPEYRPLFLFWRLLRESKSKDEALRKIERGLLNPSYGAATRLLYLRSLFLIVGYPESKIGEFISKLLTESNADLKLEIFRLVSDNMDYCLFKKYYASMTTEALTEYYKILNRIGHPGNNQLGNLIKSMANRRAENLQEILMTRQTSAIEAKTCKKALE